MNITEILVLLIASVPISIWDFDFCKKYDGWHTINIQDDIISNNKIEICKSARDKEFALAHELGHQYWFVGLSLWERNEYRKLFESSKENDFYTDYSKTNAIEDFSDNFALIVQNKKINKWEIHKQKTDFIKKTFK